MLYIRLPSGDSADSQRLVTTYTALYVSMAMEERRSFFLPAATRSHTDRWGKIEPAPWLTWTRDRMCDRYALGRFGWTTTCRQRLSVACPAQRSTALPLFRSTATSAPV